MRAVEALGHIGPEARASVPALIAILKGQDGGIRSRTAMALGRIGPDAKEAVPDLVTVLRDPDPLVRRSALEALRRFGREGRRGDWRTQAGDRGPRPEGP